MNIQHKIVSFQPTTGSLLVNYFSEEVPEGLLYNIDIPLVGNSFADKEEIEKLIAFMAPVGQLERIATLRTLTIPEELAVLIPVVAPIVEVDQSQPIIQGTDVPPIQ